MPRGKPNSKRPAAPSPATPQPTLQAVAAQPSLANTARRYVPPVAPRNLVDTGDLPAGQDGDVTMSSAGEATLQHPTIEVPDGPVSKSKLDALAFDAELVTVRVAEVDSQYPDPCISTWVSGRHQLFVRGFDITCPRKFVAVLARARPVGFGNVEYVDGDGVRHIKWPKRTAQRYPFQVVRDDNPNGSAWLRQILQEA